MEHILPVVAAIDQLIDQADVERSQRSRHAEQVSTLATCVDQIVLMQFSQALARVFIRARTL